MAHPWRRSVGTLSESLELISGVRPFPLFQELIGFERHALLVPIQLRVRMASRRNMNSLLEWHISFGAGMAIP